MKKWLALLLLIVSITSSFIPCCSSDDCEDEAIESSHKHHGQNKDTGACSPFYSCGTCISAVEITAIKSQLVEPGKEKIAHFSVYQFQLSNYSASLFQPPRLLL